MSHLSWDDLIFNLLFIRLKYLKWSTFYKIKKHLTLLCLIKYLSYENLKGNTYLYLYFEHSLGSVCVNGKYKKHIWNFTLWWLVNLSENWAFNVWTVNFINSSQLQYAIVCSGECVYGDWLKYSQPPTHQVIQPITDFSHLLTLSVCVSQKSRTC